jgi:hypothetical protein
MTYPIWIGANKDGKMIIGAKELSRERAHTGGIDKNDTTQGWCGQNAHLDDVEKVFGIQLPHRVVAKTPNGYRLMTPTEAINGGFAVSDWGQVPAYRRKEVA